MQAVQDPTYRNAVSPSPSPHGQNIDILSLQKELQDKQHELTIAYQTSLELIETNNDLQKQLEEQSTMIQNMDSNIADCEMKVNASNHPFIAIHTLCDIAI